MMEQMQARELISAMADGQLRGEAFARGMDAAASDSGALTLRLVQPALASAVDTSAAPQP